MISRTRLGSFFMFISLFFNIGVLGKASDEIKFIHDANEYLRNIVTILAKQNYSWKEYYNKNKKDIKDFVFKLDEFYFKKKIQNSLAKKYGHIVAIKYRKIFEQLNCLGCCDKYSNLQKLINDIKLMQSYLISNKSKGISKKNNYKKVDAPLSELLEFRRYNDLIIALYTKARVVLNKFIRTNFKKIQNKNHSYYVFITPLSKNAINLKFKTLKSFFDEILDELDLVYSRYNGDVKYKIKKFIANNRFNLSCIQNRIVDKTYYSIKKYITEKQFDSNYTGVELGKIINEFILLDNRLKESIRCLNENRAKINATISY